jgi:hypothetical protein
MYVISKLIATNENQPSTGLHGHIPEAFCCLTSEKPFSPVQILATFNGLTSSEAWCALSGFGKY